MNGSVAPFIPPSAGGSDMQQQHYPEEEIMTTATFMELSRVGDDGFPITSTAFDPVEELLWVGTAKGRLSAFSQPDMHKYVSVPAHKDQIRSLQCFSEGVVSIAPYSIRMHNRNCLALCAAPASDMLASADDDLANAEEENEENSPNKRKRAPEQFTCGTLTVASSSGPMGTYQGEHLMVGGDRKTVWQLDLITGMTVISKIDVPCATTCMESNRSVIIGGRDGKIRLLDGMMRTDDADRVLDAYNGAITAMCTWDDLLVTCGTQGRSLNPYDNSGIAPTRFFPDPLIKVFDLRMLRQTLPLSFSPAMVSPSLLSFIPGKERLLVGSSTSGQFLTCDPFNVSAQSTEFFQVINESGTHDTLSCAAVSGSGELLAFGTPTGAVIQWAGGPDACVNIPTQPLEMVPLVPPPPPASISPSDPSPASHYLLRPILTPGPYGLTATELASSFATTPEIANLPLRWPPRRIIDPNLVSKASTQDFLGYISNTHLQYPLNSLLFGKGKMVYMVADPRRRPGAEGGDDEDDWMEGPAGGAGQGGQVENVWDPDVPRRYRRVLIDFSKRGLDGFDFSRYNSTKCVGLENLLPNSYTNAVIQMLFYVPEIRLAMLRQQYDRACFANDASLCCELGFLFHMLDQAQAQAQELSLSSLSSASSCESKDSQEENKIESTTDTTIASGSSSHDLPTVATTTSTTTTTALSITPLKPTGPPLPCQSSNFLCVFRHIPEVVALGLLENKASPVQIRAEGFHRFLLNQIHAELTGPGGLGGGSSSNSNSSNNSSTSASLNNSHLAVGVGDADDPVDRSKVAAGGGLLEQYLKDAMSITPRGGRPPSISAVIDTLYGYNARTTNTFLHPPNVPSKVADTRSFVIELVYPRTLATATITTTTTTPRTSPTLLGQKPMTSPVSTQSPAPTTFSPTEDRSTTPSKGGPGAEQQQEKVLPTFATLLHQSICRETRSRGWCEESKGYEPLKQVRQPVTLPTILALHAGVQGNEIAQQIWHQLNPLRANWLPDRIKIAGTRTIKPPSSLSSGKHTCSAAGGEKESHGGGGGGGGGGRGRRGNKNKEKKEEEGPGILTDVIVMERRNKPIDMTGREGEEEEEKEEWMASDGKVMRKVTTEDLEGGRLSNVTNEAGVTVTTKRVVKTYEVMSVVSFVAAGGRKPNADGDGHLVLHVKVPKLSADPPSIFDAFQEEADNNNKKKKKKLETEWEWYILNDFLVGPTILEDALGFLPSWKEPCILLYREEGSAAEVWQQWRNLLSIGLHFSTFAMPSAVFDAPSLSKAHDIIQSFTPLPPSQLPGKGDIIAIDAEFVALEMEKASVREDGTRVVSKEGRQALGRLSCIDDRTGLVMMDDYVLPSEPVVDYLTRFSGLTREDLDPLQSRHHLVTQRIAYLKLRYLIDRGVILVGHGLKKDFRIINVFVPPSQVIDKVDIWGLKHQRKISFRFVAAYLLGESLQVIDTVDIWGLEHQRKISLRFLAAYLLGESIQGETHDSIEDARTALRLYKKYLEHKEAGTLEKTINLLYEVGRKTQWKIGNLTFIQQQRGEELR